MVTVSTFRQLATAFENANEQPHFEKTSFRVNKKIFATLDELQKRAVLKLSGIDQSVFCAFDPAIIYPVKGAWGKKGWTVFELTLVPKAMMTDALKLAFHAL